MGRVRGPNSTVVWVNGLQNFERIGFFPLKPTWNGLFWRFTHLKFNISPLKSYQNPKRKNNLPTIIFQGKLLNFGSVKSFPSGSKLLISTGGKKWKTAAKITMVQWFLWKLINPYSKLPSLKLKWPLKINGWKMNFLLGRPIFRGYVSFREGNSERCFQIESTNTGFLPSAMMSCLWTHI